MHRGGGRSAGNAPIGLRRACPNAPAPAFISLESTDQHFILKVSAPPGLREAASVGRKSIAARMLLAPHGTVLCRKRQPACMERTMNWTQIEGQWTELTGQLKSQWAKLTDDDLMNVAGKKDQLLGKLQQRYGLLKADAEVQLEKWLAKIAPAQGDSAVKKADATKPAHSPPREG
jgi:uncharacterized protein YjbJ (UPF0337 family)